jgi:hypothetical protein
MSIRPTLIAVAAAASSAVAGAQPDKDQPQAQTPSAAPSAPVVLASASDVRREAATTPTQPVRRPAPRVTTCRCGDQRATEGQPSGESPEQ